VRILGRKTVEYMTSNQLGPEVDTEALRTWPNLNGYGFGLGVAVRKGGGVAGILGTPGDFNWGGAFGTYFWVDPKEELTVVLMAHAPGEARVHMRQLITTLVYPTLMK
jgi:CubicO group peptidase (beta-lactamase class C family)